MPQSFLKISQLLVKILKNNQIIEEEKENDEISRVVNAVFEIQRKLIECKATSEEDVKQVVRSMLPDKDSTMK